MISVFMIVRNEEATLPGALASVAGLADEVVIGDTGSTDGSVALAESLGARVVTGLDRMHKGEARNAVLDTATGDWCVMLDADERVRDAASIRGFLERSSADGVHVFVAENGMATQQLRAFRRGSFRYRYRAHEIPLPVNGHEPNVIGADIVFDHLPPAERFEWKAQYTLERLKLDVEENPDDPHPRYFLGRHYLHLGEFEQAIETMQTYLRISDPEQHARAEAYAVIGDSYAGQGDIGRALMWFHQAVHWQPERQLWWWRMADLHGVEQRWDLCWGLCQLVLTLAPDRELRPWIPYNLAAIALEQMGRYGEAHQHATIADRLRG